MFRHTEVASMLYCSVKDVVYMCRNNIIRNTQKPNTNIYLIPVYALQDFIKEITTQGFQGIKRDDGSFIFPPVFISQKLVEEHLQDVVQQDKLVNEARSILAGAIL